MDEAEVMSKEIIQSLFDQGVSIFLLLYIFISYKKRIVDGSWNRGWIWRCWMFLYCCYLDCRRYMKTVLLCICFNLNYFFLLFSHLELAKIDPSISALCDIHVNKLYSFLKKCKLILFYIEHFNKHCYSQMGFQGTQGKISHTSCYRHSR